MSVATAPSGGMSTRRATMVAAALGLIFGVASMRAWFILPALTVGIAAIVVGAQIPWAVWIGLLLQTVGYGSYIPNRVGTLLTWASTILFIAGCWIQHRPFERSTWGVMNRQWPWALCTWIAVWMAWAGISLLGALDPLTARKEFIRYGISFALLLTYLHSIRSPRHVRMLLAAAVLAASPIAVVFILQRVFERFIPGLMLIGPYPPTRGDVSVQFAAILPILFGLRVAGHRLAFGPALSWLISWPMVALFLAGTVASDTRATLLASIVGSAATLAWLRPGARRGLLIAGVAMGLLLLLFLQVRYGDLRTGLQHNLSGRLQVWTAAVRAIREHPVIGVGPGNWEAWFGQHYRAADFLMPDMHGNAYTLQPTQLGGQAHHLLLTKAAEMGVPSVIGLIGMWLSWWAAARAALTRIPEGWRRALAIGSVGSAIGLLTTCFFENGPLIGTARATESVVVWMVLVFPLALARSEDDAAPDRSAEWSTR